MDALKSLNFSIKFLGYQEDGGKVGVQVYLYMAIQFIMGLNISYFLLERWYDIDDRIIALKTIAFVVTYLAYSVSMVFYWNDFSSVIKLFHNSNFKVPYETSKRRNALLQEFDTVMKKLNKTWWAIIVAYVTPFNIIPIGTVFIKVWFFSQDFQKVIKENLSAPFPLYYPESISIAIDKEWMMNTLVYVTGYLVHSSYMLFTCVYAHLAHVTTLCAMADVVYELKLLQLSLEEMNQLIQQSVLLGNGFDKLTLDNALKHFIRYFIQHHQDTYRRFNLVNKGIRWIVTTVGVTASLYMCMSIYTIVQKDQVMLKFQEGLFFLLWAFAIYLFDVCGEKVRTEDEHLRSALYECSWITKPDSFKKSLLISMIRGCRPMDIKPFGLFAFNLNNYAKTMNAAYSYYNLLYKFKHK